MSFAYICIKITLEAASSTVFVKVRVMRTQEKLAEVPSFILRGSSISRHGGWWVLSTCCLLASSVKVPLLFAHSCRQAPCMWHPWTLRFWNCQICTSTDTIQKLGMLRFAAFSGGFLDKMWASLIFLLLFVLSVSTNDTASISFFVFRIPSCGTWFFDPTACTLIVLSASGKDASGKHSQCFIKLPDMATSAGAVPQRSNPELILLLLPVIALPTLLTVK